MPHGREVGLMDGDPAPIHHKGAEPPNFRPMSPCGQTAAWMKLALGTEVGLGPATLC